MSSARSGGFVPEIWVEERSDWGGFIARSEVAIAESLEIWGELTRKSIEEHETRVGDASSTRAVWPGRHLRDSIKVTAPKRWLGGWYVKIWSPDPNKLWQEEGTLGSRRRALSAKTIARRNSPSGRARQARVSGSSGVKALHFMRDGMLAAFPAGVQVVRRHLGR